MDVPAVIAGAPRSNALANSASGLTCRLVRTTVGYGLAEVVIGQRRSQPKRSGLGTKTDDVERSIREIIETELGPDGRLPSERELVTRLGAGRTTIRLVLIKLTAERIIRSEHGRGYFAIAADDQEGE